jgi:predicted TIM-barrel fold metal-dependent hydrolase
MGRFTRKDMLAGVIALGAGAALAERGLEPRPAGAAEGSRLDVHHHYMSPEWKAALVKQKIEGTIDTMNWSVAGSLATMDAGGVATAILSTTNPGVWFGDDAQAKMLARNMNDFGAELVRDHKPRYGLFAVLPLPNAQLCLPEIAYAFDTLHADGISVLSSYGTKWLGDPAFEPVWAELDRRKAIVFSHATTADCCGLLQPHIPYWTIEFNTDTARSIISVIENGVAQRYPNIRFIWSHAGGTILALAGRYFRKQANYASLHGPVPPDSPLGHLRRFYYDIAGSANQIQMQALRTMVPTSHILFGTDYPWDKAADLAAGLADSRVFSAAELRAIERDNILQLLPQYA